MYEVIFVTVVCVALLSSNIKVTTMKEAPQPYFPRLNRNGEPVVTEKEAPGIDKIASALDASVARFGPDLFSRKYRDVDIMKMISRKELPENLYELLRLELNTPHHGEKYLINHVLMMLDVLHDCFNWAEWHITKVRRIVLAIILHDIGMSATKKPHKSETWADFDDYVIGSLVASTKGFSGRNIEDVITEAMKNGEPTSTYFGHAEAGVKILQECPQNAYGYGPNWLRSVMYLIANHMKAHQLWGYKKNEAIIAKAQMPDYVAKIIEATPGTGLGPAYWPSWDDVSSQLAHGQSLSKKDYKWMVMYACEELEILQYCDEHGAIRGPLEQ